MNNISVEQPRDSNNEICNKLAEPQSARRQLVPNTVVYNLNTISASSENITTAEVNTQRPSTLINNETEQPALDKMRDEQASVSVMARVAEPGEPRMERESEPSPSTRTSKNWMLKYLGCVMITTVAAGFLGAFAYGRSQRDARSAALAFPAIDITTHRAEDTAITDMNTPAFSTYSTGEKNKHNEIGIEYLPYRGRMKRGLQDTARLDPRIPGARRGNRVSNEYKANKDDGLRTAYLKHLAYSNEQRAERRTLIHRANNLKPDTALNITDIGYRDDNSEFRIPFIVYKTSKTVIKDWFFFETSSDVAAVYMKPLFRCDCGELELEP